ncbi:MAG: 7 transmembrane receptor, partial [Candidatus Thiodiazotropha taylori]|nr:7 transmembrane receptor [Candidatus Thiodiazotropha taylori]MCW4285785.1 7 transmembrane receptor [Candidatus Thiodiazotropha taylori]
SVDCTALTDNLTQPIYLPSSTRMLNTSHNKHAFNNLRLNNTNVIFLVYLDVAGCGAANTSILSLEYMYNLVTLDFSSNEISNIESDTFINQKRLKYLYLHDNYAILTVATGAFVGLQSLAEMMLTGLHIDRISKGAFSRLKLSKLSFSGSRIGIFEDDVFEFLTVEMIFLNSTVIGSFPSTLFKGVEDLSSVYTDAYTFCCIKPSYLPADQCYPHENEFSSCADLMRNEVLRAMLWIIGLLALLGNILSLGYRFIFDRNRLKTSHGIFVTNLAASDLMMGLYLIIIAGADMRYRGDYIFVDNSWRNSALCHFAGILATMSSEASVFIMCFITLDRILVVKYPFGQVRFNQTSANVCMTAVWIVSLVISIIPVLFTSYFRGAYYSKTGVCLALPLTRDRPPGWLYAVGIFIVLNSISFSLIACGQWLIYREIKKSEKSMAHARLTRNNDLRVARNLLLVVTTDFLCWFPVGVLGAYYCMCSQFIPILVITANSL